MNLAFLFSNSNCVFISILLIVLIVTVCTFFKNTKESFTPTVESTNNSVDDPQDITARCVDDGNCQNIDSGGRLIDSGGGPIHSGGGLCPTNYNPVCAGNRTYGNSCKAEKAGNNTWTQGDCSAQTQNIDSGGELIDSGGRLIDSGGGPIHSGGGLCPTNYNPVCAGNRTYGNSCKAEKAGNNTWTQGDCSAQTGSQFRTFTDMVSGTPYCIKEYADEPPAGKQLDTTHTYYRTTSELDNTSTIRRVHEQPLCSYIPVTDESVEADQVTCCWRASSQ